jgi:hypothetical protein
MQKVTVEVLGGREQQSVYNSLRAYCRRHPILGVEVVQIDGAIHLQRTEVTTGNADPEFISANAKVAAAMAEPDPFAEPTVHRGEERTDNVVLKQP